MAHQDSTPQDARTLVDSAWSPMEQAAVGAHEMFKAYLAAGFTETQALVLIGTIVAQGNNRG